MGTSHSAPVGGSCRLRRGGFRVVSIDGLDLVGGSGLEEDSVVLSSTSGISVGDRLISCIGAVAGSS